MKKMMPVLLLFILLLSACYYPGAHMMDWEHMGYGYGGVIMWIILILIIGIVAYFVIKGQKSITKDDEETPLEILKMRYAKGEISKQEFEKMKKDIE
jgi:putative membrane protein